MRILADTNIPFVEEAFGPYGEVRKVDGRGLSAAALRDVDALLIRSVTRVDAKLLEGSSVSFVGSATAGTDHVDVGELDRRGIAFAAAPGSNAESVAQWVTSVLIELQARLRRPLRAMTLGVVGVGQVGRRVVNKARALGMNVLLNDPPRARAEGPGAFVSLEDLCLRADIITLHVPLYRTGPDRTEHLFSPARLARLALSTCLLNASRGAVVDGAALADTLAHKQLAFAALDVWEGEPNIDMGLLDLVDIGTAHIAGYGVDGKVRGTAVLHDAFVAHFGLTPRWSSDLVFSAGPTLDVAGEAAVGDACRGTYDVGADDARLRGLLALDSDRRGREFDALRADYPARREYAEVRVTAGPDVGAASLEVLTRLGFVVL